MDFIHELEDIMSSIIGPQFDIVGFDPRGMCRTKAQCFVQGSSYPTFFLPGVGQSTPRVSFFKSAAERAILYGSGIHCRG